MKNTQPFNNEEMNKGFQLDTSLLSPEQLTHVLQIFEARMHQPFSLSDFGGGNRYLGYGYYYDKVKEPLVVTTTVDFWNAPLIDYPTLCRGAVQLEPNTYAVFENGVSAIWAYVTSINSNYLAPSERDFDIIWFDGTYFLTSKQCRLNIALLWKISPEDFERKLRGIYPVVRENQTTETKGFEDLSNKPVIRPEDTHGIKELADELKKIVMEGEKPRYLKSTTGNGLIVQRTGENEDDVFTGVVVVKGTSPHELGYKSSTWYIPEFKPCDYTPEPVNQGEDSPAIEQPNENFSLDGFLEYLREEYRKKKQLEQENDQLKEENVRYADSIFRHQDTVDRQKTEIKEQWDTINALRAELSTLKGEAEPVYNYDWLGNAIRPYKLSSVDSGIVAVPYGDFDPVRLDPKTSADIIVRAVAKELNGDWDGQGDYSCLGLANSDKSYVVANCIRNIHLNTGTAEFKDYATAQKAITILDGIDQQILKNYLV